MIELPSSSDDPSGRIIGSTVSPPTRSISAGWVLRAQISLRCRGRRRAHGSTSVAVQRHPESSVTYRRPSNETQDLPMAITDFLC